MSQSIELVAFSRTFTTGNGEVHAVSPTNVEIEAGSFVAVVGPSGCGKSTILRAIAGLDLGFDGAVLVNGAPVTKPSPTRGVVFQEPRLFPWLTVERNIAAGLAGRRSDWAPRVAELVELVGLSGFEQAHPSQLSGGMAQRAAIARALAPRPEVLLLDEPFSALDAFTRIHLQDAYQQIWSRERVTSILVTHDIEEAVVLAQRVLVMSPRPGRIDRILDVNLPYPRDRTDPRIDELRRTLLQFFQLSRESPGPH